MIRLIGSLWHVPRMCAVGDKLLNSIKSMYVNIPACAKVRGVRTSVLGLVAV